MAALEVQARAPAGRATNPSLIVLTWEREWVFLGVCGTQWEPMVNDAPNGRL
jgi:hypothetical protein